MSNVFNEKFYEHLTTDDLANEEWKIIEAYKGLFQVSSCGRVKSLERFAKTSRGDGLRPITERIMKPTVKSDGYLHVCLSKEGKRKHFLVHRLVAMAFCENPESKPTVNHINGKKTDNRAINLEFATPKEQTEHIWNHPAMSKQRESVMNTVRTAAGENNGNSKLSDVDCELIKIKYATGNYFQKNLAEEFGIGQSHVSRIVRGETRSRPTPTP